MSAKVLRTTCNSTRKAGPADKRLDTKTISTISRWRIPSHQIQDQSAAVPFMVSIYHTYAYSVNIILLNPSSNMQCAFHSSSCLLLLKMQKKLLLWWYELCLFLSKRNSQDIENKCTLIFLLNKQLFESQFQWRENIKQHFSWRLRWGKCRHLTTDHKGNNKYMLKKFSVLVFLLWLLWLLEKVVHSCKIEETRK